MIFCVDKHIDFEYIVITMNDMPHTLNNDFLSFQAARLQNLITEMVECCEDRKIYESQKFGLPYSELKSLMLFNGERYLTVKGIAQRLEVAKSRVTKIIDGLIDKELVQRFEDPKDARIKLISLTQAGRKKAEEIRDFQKGLHRQILIHLGSDESKTVLSKLEMLRSAMEYVKKQLN